MGKQKRKFEQHFYVGDVIQYHREDVEDVAQWKVLSAKFVEWDYKDAWGYDQWEYDVELVGWGDVENVVITRLSPNNYKILRPGEARLWA